MSSIENYIKAQDQDRHAILASIHKIIVSEDKSVKATIAPMMGKEMIIYNAPDTFKYGLSSVKNYMSLHVMPIYGSVKLYEKYKALLPKASFQKGCINFKNADEMPLAVVQDLIKDCSKIDLRQMKEDWIKSKKVKK